MSTTQINRKRKRINKQVTTSVIVELFNPISEIKLLKNWSPHICKPKSLIPLLKIKTSEIAFIKLLRSILRETCHLCQKKELLSIRMELVLTQIQKKNVNDIIELKI
jgi:hypothetical protein